MIMMDDRMRYMDSLYVFFESHKMIFLVRLFFLLIDKSVVQLKSFDNISFFGFRWCVERAVISIFSFTFSSSSAIDHPVFKLNDEQWQKHIDCHCYIIWFLLYVWQEAQFLVQREERGGESSMLSIILKYYLTRFINNQRRDCFDLLRYM